MTTDLAPASPQALGAQGAPLSTSGGRWYYQIRAGESLLDLAQFFGKKPADLVAVVQLNTNLPKKTVGGVQTLVLAPGNRVQVPGVWVFPEAAKKRGRALGRALGADDDDDGGDPLLNMFCDDGYKFSVVKMGCVFEDSGQPCGTGGGATYNDDGQCVYPGDNPACPPGYTYLHHDDAGKPVCFYNNAGEECDGGRGIRDGSGQCIPKPKTGGSGTPATSTTVATSSSTPAPAEPPKEEGLVMRTLKSPRFWGGVVVVGLAVGGGVMLKRRMKRKAAGG